MMKQKAREKHLNLGDSNTKYFYSVFKANKKRNKITSILNDQGLLVTDHAQIEEVFLECFNNILCPENNGDLPSKTFRIPWEN